MNSSLVYDHTSKLGIGEFDPPMDGWLLQVLVCKRNNYEYTITCIWIRFVDTMFATCFWKRRKVLKF